MNLFKLNYTTEYIIKMIENKCIICRSSTVTKKFIMNTELNIKQPICRSCSVIYNGTFKIKTYRPYDCCQAEDCTSVIIDIIDGMRYCKVHNPNYNKVKIIYRKDIDKTHICMCSTNGMTCNNKSLYYYIDNDLIYLICNDHSKIDILEGKTLINYVVTRICADADCFKIPSFYHADDENKRLKYCSTHVPKTDEYINIKTGKPPKYNNIK